MAEALCSSAFPCYDRLTLKSCTRPTGLSSGRLVTGRAANRQGQKYVSTCRLPCSFTRHRDRLLTPNKLSPPRDLHKSIKSLLVEFGLAVSPRLVISSPRVVSTGKMFDRCSVQKLDSLGEEGSVSGASYDLSNRLTFFDVTCSSSGIYQTICTASSTLSFTCNPSRSFFGTPNTRSIKAIAGLGTGLTYLNKEIIFELLHYSSVKWNFDWINILWNNFLNNFWYTVDTIKNQNQKSKFLYSSRVERPISIEKYFVSFLNIHFR